jgi:heat shock protein HtpX
MFKRLALFMALNLGIMLTLGVLAHLFGFTGGTGKNLELTKVFGFSIIFGFGGAFISLLVSKPMAKWSVSARPVDTNTSQGRWLYSTVENQAQRAGLKMPEVCIYDSAEPNAFATGAFKNSALVAVSTGLLDRLSKDEVEAVLGHEIGHIANGDMVTMTLLQGVLNTFVIFIARILGWVFDRVIMKNEEEGPGIGQIAVTFILEIMLGLAATVVMAWFSRRREFRADIAGAELTTKKSMADALRRLAGDAPGAGLPANLAAFGMRNSHSWLAIFSTHPPMEQRIAALEDRR